MIADFSTHFVGDSVGSIICCCDGFVYCETLHLKIKKVGKSPCTSLRMRTHMYFVIVSSILTLEVTKATSFNVEYCILREIVDFK